MKKLLLILLLLIAGSISYSQFRFVAANAVNAAGTYTDLGNNGTVITTPTFDDDNSAAQNIGFIFFYNGTTFTQFVLNTNGVIKLGATGPADVQFYDALGSTETNLIYPLNFDLIGGTNPEYRVHTSGTAPNRVCTIQFKNVRDYFASPNVAPQFSDMDFQIKLYETTNNIEFVYGPFFAGGAASAATFTEAGIKGKDANHSVNVTKASATAWSSALFINGVYPGNLHNIRNTVLPVTGQTYRFVSAPLLNNDAQVSNVYTLGKIPVAFGSPHIVKTVVSNEGDATITNLVVTLNVTGANAFTNTQTVVSLAPGATETVSFSGYTSTNMGTNTVTVSVAADDNNSNNSVAANQAVNAGIFSYTDNSTSSNSVGYNPNVAGLFVNKYTLSGSAFATGVNVFISADPNNTGNTVYAVVLDATGTLIGQSANYIITTGDLGLYKSFTINTAPMISNGNFYVGLAQTANATGYLPLGLQTESPVRPGAYYVAPLAGGSPTEITSLGRFMIEAVVSATPLAIKISEFSGRIQNNTAFLNWLTSFENNNDRFEVEKSQAGTNAWIKIGTVAAGGNSTVNQKYQFTDPGLGNGRWMYRLKIFNKDGTFTYSPIVILQLTDKSIFVLEQNYPNPVNAVTMIRYNLGKDAIVTIELFSIDGKKIMSNQKGKQTKGSYNMPIDVKSLGLSNGKYVYRMVIKDATTGEMSAFKKEMNVIR